MGGFHDRLHWQDVSNLRFEGLGYLGFDAGLSGRGGETETSSKKEEPHAISRGAAKCGIRSLDAPVDRWLHLLINTEMMIVAVHRCGACVRRAYNDKRDVAKM